MRAARIHGFGPPDVIVIDDLPKPTPRAGQLLVRVAAAGVGPWDALIRERKSVVGAALPLTLGSDLSGSVEKVGPGVADVNVGDEIYGVTNPQFIGACAEYAIASANKIARKPAALDFIVAASVPVVAVTAWQMLHDYAKVQAGQRILIHGAAGNVGSYCVQLARRANLEIIATASASDLEYLRNLGAETVLDYRGVRFEDEVRPVDAVLDLVGGDTQKRSYRVIKPGGILVSIVSEPMKANPSDNIRSVFFIVDVTTARLQEITARFNDGTLSALVGTVLPLEQVRKAHEMLAGAPHERGKIVLRIAAG